MDWTQNHFIYSILYKKLKIRVYIAWYKHEEGLDNSNFIYTRAADDKLSRASGYVKHKVSVFYFFYN